MKKAISIILAVILSISMCACSSTQPDSTEEDGTTVKHEESGDTYIYESFPRTIIYKDYTLSLDAINFYEYNTDSSGYPKNIIVSLRFDLSDLTDEEFYWFQEDNETTFDSDRPIHSSLNVTSEDNEFDYEDLMHLKTIFLLDSKYAVYYYTMYPSSRNYRYSLAGEHISIGTYVKSGGTFKYKDRDLDKTDTYYYFEDIPETLETLDDLKSNFPSEYELLASKL